MVNRKEDAIEITMVAEIAQTVILFLLLLVTFLYTRAMGKSVQVMQMQTLNQQGQKVEEMYLQYSDIYLKL